MEYGGRQRAVIRRAFASRYCLSQEVPKHSNSFKVIRRGLKPGSMLS